MSERNLYEVTGDIKDINTLLVSREEWNRRAQPTQAGQVPPDVVRDAERWRMLRAYFHEYRIDAMKLYRDIDAAIAQQKGHNVNS